MKDKLSSKAEGVLVREAERLQGILAELGAPHHRYKMTLPAPPLLGERMWVAGESSAAYSRYEDFVEDTVPFLRREMELMLAAENPPTVRMLVRLAKIGSSGTATLMTGRDGKGASLSDPKTRVPSMTTSLSEKEP